MPKEPEDQPYRFTGFTSPNYTQVPDQLFDELLPQLTESELKVLLYIIRRTFGFKKTSDDISLKQLTEGIKLRSGEHLDYGAGVSKTSAVRGVNGLIDKNIINAVRNRSVARGDEPTTYELVLTAGVSRFETRGTSPVSTFETPPPLNLDTARVPDMDTQETVEQETDSMDRPIEISRGKLPKFDPDRQTISDIMGDFARELGDAAPLPSTASRAYNIFRDSGQSIDDFIDALYEARRITKERTGSIRGATTELGRPKPKMSYFFTVLSNLIAA